MELFPTLEKAFSRDTMSAKDAQAKAEFIAWGPAVFQASRLMVKLGILEMIRDSADGMTRQEIAAKTKLSDYAVKCLTEAALCIGLIIVDTKTNAFSLTKTGWFLLNDPAARVNLDFNHDVNYEGWFFLEESLINGKPEGLKHFGSWPTVYEGLSSLPKKVQDSWFGFDHFYSDSSFPQALEIIFSKYHTESLFDVGGNTGKWALQCVGFDPDVEVTILDLPQQIEMMYKNIECKKGADRIHGYGIDLLDKKSVFPKSSKAPDAIWMSQFLDCFSMEEIVSILSRAKTAMQDNTRVFIMETLWDRQRFVPASFCLTMTSLYFTAIANGNSKMYNTEDMRSCIEQAGLEIETIFDGLGQGHSIIVVRLKK